MPTPNIQPIAGISNTGTMNISINKRDVDPRLFYLDYDKYPLASAIFAMGSSLERDGEGVYTVKRGATVKQTPCINPKFEWTESDRLKQAFHPAAAVTAVATSVTVSSDDAPYFLTGQHLIMINAAGEIEEVRITAGGQTTTLTVSRNVGSTGAIALTTGDYVYAAPVHRAENSTSVDANQIKSETLYNQVMFLSESYGLTRIQKATVSFYSGDSYDQVRKEALDRLKQRMEMAFWFGRRDVLNSTTNPIYCNGGIFWSLQNLFTDVPTVDVGGILTKPVWEAAAGKAMRHGSRNKVVFLGSAGLNAINGFVSGTIAPSDPNIKEFGTLITSYRTAGGSVSFMYEPLFDEVTALNGTAVVLDMKNIGWRYLAGNGENLNLHAEEDIQENDRSVKKGEWIVVGGLQVSTGKSHMIIINIQG